MTIYVPVISKTGKPLMPCHPARARILVRNGKAVRRFNKGIFYIQLTEREDGEVQPIAVGIDPGSKKEGFTVKSEAHTYLNIQADAVWWVCKHLEIRRNCRRNRRYRNTPCRKNRLNRQRSGNVASTHARWNWKIRICDWLLKLYPISDFVVEDVKAKMIKGNSRWNRSFSPLHAGKNWFYSELKKRGNLHLKRGFETKSLRDALGLPKLSNKLADNFFAHCCDSFVLANSIVGGHVAPDFIGLLCITPIRFHRRQLYFCNTMKGGEKKRFGGTRSLGFKKGSLVINKKYGFVYIGGYIDTRLTIHSVKTGKRLSRYAKPQDCIFLAYNSWRVHFVR